VNKNSLEKYEEATSKEITFISIGLACSRPWDRTPAQQNKQTNKQTDGYFCVRKRKKNLHIVLKGKKIALSKRTFYANRNVPYQVCNKQAR
jgi:hypothetical protein